MNDGEKSDPMPTIELQQLLKREGLVGSGGEAKHRIQGGEVSVNGEIETRRRRRLREGDVVVFGETTIRVVLAEGAGDRKG